MREWICGAPAVFWISLLGLAYIYAGYPVLVWLVARIRPRPIAEGHDPGGPITVIVVAHNEAAVLPGKMESLLASTIAPRIREIIVVSDASTDGTEAVVAGLPDARIRCLAFAERRGKASCINDGAASATGDILVLTDARQAVAPDALEILVRCLHDPAVGVASGELVFCPASLDRATGAGVGAYWGYEKFIRRQESRIQSVPGVTGALYALPRDRFRPLPADTILDDVWLPMTVIGQGGGCVLASRAYVYDAAAETLGVEWARKRRTLAGCVQLVRRNPRWLRHGTFFNHKAARLASPFLLLGMLAGSWVVAPWLFGVQVGAYLAIALAWIPTVRGIRIPLLGVMVLFVVMNGAVLAAIWDGLHGHYPGAWDVHH